ncbi:hypothetical protein J5Y03_09665 [Bacillus sp. RG28]|uniref:Uncharacterized protein n=1 Tax=Gottfriedia endophytica TaxID=2820819 RepID=A0A940NJB9_9BACI|nr:hypothetical protein [Gottfriedia endophytica]MBP0725455.1 hypothetical protein [Gottfriedia endophytica]
MGFSAIFLLGIACVIIITLLKNRILPNINTENKLTKKLQHTKWYQNHYLSGGFVFIMNAILFSLAVLIIFLVSMLHIPFLHLFVMGAATFISIWFWALINVSWKGRKGNRIKMGSIGSSFYLLLGIFFLYKLMTLKPSYPGEDTFMAGIGLLFGIIVTLVAWITCFIFTALVKKIREV